MSRIIKTLKNGVISLQQVITQHYGRTDYVTKFQKGTTPILASVMFYYTYRQLFIDEDNPSRLKYLDLQPASSQQMQRLQMEQKVKQTQNKSSQISIGKV